MSANTAFNANSLPCKSEINATRIRSSPGTDYSGRTGAVVNVTSHRVVGAICNVADHATAPRGSAPHAVRQIGIDRRASGLLTMLENTAKRRTRFDTLATPSAPSPAPAQARASG